MASGKKDVLVELKGENLEKDLEIQKETKHEADSTDQQVLIDMEGEDKSVEGKVPESKFVVDLVPEMASKPSKFSFRETVHNFMTKGFRKKDSKKVLANLEHKEVVRDAMIINIELVSKLSKAGDEDDDGLQSMASFDIPQIEVPMVDTSSVDQVEHKRKSRSKMKRDETIDPNYLQIPEISTKDIDLEKVAKKKKKKEKKATKMKMIDGEESDLLIGGDHDGHKSPTDTTGVDQLEIDDGAQQDKKSIKKALKKSKDKGKKHKSVEMADSEKEKSKKPVILTEIQITMKEKDDGSKVDIGKDLPLEKPKSKVKIIDAKTDLMDYGQTKAVVEKKEKSKSKHKSETKMEPKSKISFADVVKEKKSRHDKEKSLDHSKEEIKKSKIKEPKPDSSKKELKKQQTKATLEVPEVPKSGKESFRDFFTKKKIKKQEEVIETMKSLKRKRETKAEPKKEILKKSLRSVELSKLKELDKVAKSPEEKFDKMIVDLNQELKQKLEQKRKLQMERSKTIDEGHMRAIETIDEEDDTFTVPNRDEFKKRLSEVLMRKVSVERKHVKIKEPPEVLTVGPKRPLKDNRRPKPMIIKKQHSTVTSEIEIPVQHLTGKEDTKPTMDHHTASIGDICPLKLDRPVPFGPIESSPILSIKAERTNIIKKIVKALPTGENQEFKFERTQDVIISVPKEPTRTPSPGASPGPSHKEKSHKHAKKKSKEDKKHK